MRQIVCVNVGNANEIVVVFKQSTGQDGVVHPTVTRFYFVREHRLHGIVTGMQSIKIMASLGDKLDRLLVSFKDAKVGGSTSFEVVILTFVSQVALLEWSDAVHDLITVSIHTYERAPQLVSNVRRYVHHAITH